MNMHLTVLPEDRTLGEILQRAPKPGFDRARAIGLSLTIALHGALALAIVYGGFRIAHDVMPPPIMISLDKPKADAKAPPPPVPLVQPPPQYIRVPEVNIASDVPPLIQTVATPVPAVRADPPPVASGETQQSYLARLLSYLNRYKRYPAEAKAARIQGVVLLHFVMDKSGHVTSFEISRSSGKPALDEEALALIQRAQPLPPIPADFGKDTLNAIVPIEFSLH
ncbi:MAG: energy transducer TonB [Rhizomicrobium sp.]